MRYILWVAALLGACDVIRYRRHFGFYQKLEIVKKRNKLEIFYGEHVQ